MLKRKNAGGGIADVDEKKSTVVGYASRFGNVDSYGDIVVKGAFKRTIDHNGKRVKSLMHHDAVSVVGKPVAMYEDDSGLYTETKVSDTALGRDLLTLIADGVIDEMSIGYIPVVEEYDSKAEVNLVKEVKLIEYSFVTLAANPEARIQGLKGTAAMSEVVSSMKRMEKALRDGTFVTDEVPEAIEFIVKYWRSVLESTSEEVVENNVIVDSEKDGSDDESTRLAQDGSPVSTRDGILDVLEQWKQEQREREVIALIQSMGNIMEAR
ncbi:MAG: HK97 family phage prohead protease [Actinobacteria bacterium]|nr:HK97 family phage prohead protease [Actinomycetota bacterium]